MYDLVRESSLDYFFQEVPSNLAIVDHEFNMLWTTRSLGRLLEYEPSDQGAKKCYALLGRESACEICPISVSDECIESTLNPIKVQHGTLEEQATPLCDRSGRLIGAICQFNPLSNVETSSESMFKDGQAGKIQLDLESHEVDSLSGNVATSVKLAQVVKNASDGIIITDIQGRITYVNPAFEEMSGYTLKELNQTDPSDLIDIGTESHSIAKSIRPLTLKDGEWKGQLHCRRKSGEIYPVETRVFTIRNPSGQVVEIAAIQQDVSERFRIETEKQKFNERFHYLVKNSRDVIVIIDREGKELYVNDSVKQMTGYSPEEVLNKSGFSFLHPDDKAKVSICLSKLVETPGESLSLEYRHRHKDGGYVHIEAIGTNYLHVPSVEGIVLNLRDITERKMAQGREEQLRNRLVQFQKMESIGRLAGGVAHDFNNILSIIIGYSEQAMDKLERNLSVVDDLGHIQDAAHRSADLTRQLLAFARKQTIAPRVISINSTVKEIFSMMERLIGSSINLNWKPDKTLWSVRADPTQIEQIITNLIVNARDAIDQNGTISIATRNETLSRKHSEEFFNTPPGEYAVLSVSDNGCGIPDEHLENLFEPFFTTKDQGQGTGLGLATVYGIVKQNNGAISVKSEVGFGSVFHVFLPRYVGAEIDERSTVVRKSARSSGETIMVVEDEFAILNLIEKILKSKGFNVISTSSPKRALQMVQSGEFKIDLLLTDVVMPEINGERLFNMISKIDPEIKCLYMSGYSGELVSLNGKLDEQTNFLRKPFKMRELFGKVREVLDHQIS